MKIIYIVFFVTYQMKKYSIQITNLTNGEEVQTSSTLEVLPGEDNFQFESTELLKKLNKWGVGNYIIQFNGNSQSFRTLLKMNNNKVQRLKVEVATDLKQEILSIFLLKDYSNKSSTIDSVQKQKVIDLTEEQMKQFFNQQFDNQTTQGNQSEIPDQQQQQPEQEKTFFQKYFWYIMIGGFLVMQIMNFDKQKLTQAMQEAQQQANQRQNQNNQVRR